MQEDQYQEGYDAGYAKGYGDGRDDYENDGYDGGYDDGYDSGFEAGENEVYSASYDVLDQAAAQVEDILNDSVVFGLEISSADIIAKAAQIIRSINLE